MSVSSTGLVTWTPAATGSYSITVTVTDSEGGTATQSFTLPAVDDAALSPPTFATTPTTTALVGETWQYQALAVDPQGDAISYYLGSAPPGMQIDSQTGLVSWTPDATMAGPQSISILAVDSRGAGAYQTFTLNVTTLATDGSPTITSAPPTNVLLGTTYVYTPAADDPNAPASGYPALTYSLSAPSGSSVPAGMTINPVSGVITWTPTIGQVGPNPVLLVVTDGEGASATQPFTVNVDTLPVPQQPPAILSTAPTIAIIGQVYAYNSQGDDPQNNALAWSLKSAPAGMSINPTTGSIRWTPTLSQAGTQTYVLQLSDSMGLTTTQSVTVSVVQNAAPPQITSAPPTTGTVAQLYAYQLGATTATGQPLVYSLLNAPSGMTIDSTTGAVRWTPYDYGTFPVSIAVTDSLGQTATQNYNLTISLQAALLPPAIVTQPLTSALEGITYQQQIVAQDPQGRPVTYSLTEYPVGMTTRSVDRRHLLAPSGVGSIPVIVVATDSAGLNAVLAYTLTVHPDVAPTITSILLPARRSPAAPSPMKLRPTATATRSATAWPRPWWAGS